MTTYTFNKQITKPANGATGWDVPLNADWDLVDTCLAGTTTINVTGVSGTTTLTLTQYQPPNIEFNGTISAQLAYRLPNVGGVWTIYNNTTGPYALIIGITAGNSITLPQGYRTQLVSDGSTLAYAQSVSPAFIGSAIFPRTPQEQAASVTPANLQFNNNPHDVRRYTGWNGDGVTDDSAAWNTLASVVAQGGNGIIPPGNTYVANQVAFTVPTGCNSVVFGYGVDLYTNNGTTANAIDGLQLGNSTGGNSNGLTVLGITYYQLDAVATSGFNINDGSSIKLEDCAVVVSSTVQANNSFECVKIMSTNGTYGLWNKIINLDIRQMSGNSSYWAPFGISMGGACNATTIRDCKLNSCNYLINLSNVGSGSTLPNAVVIDSNHFEGGGTGIIVQGNNVASTQIQGLRVVNNRAENLTGDFVLFYNLASDSVNVPTFLAGNYFVSSISGYIGQSSVPTITVQSLDFGLVPNYQAGGVTSASPFVFTTQATGALNYDAVQAIVQSPGGGMSVYHAGTQYAQMLYKSGGGGAFNLPNGGGYQWGGTQVVAAQQTTSVASATFTANSGTPVESGSTFDGYTLAQVVKALRIHGLLQ